MTLEEVTNYVAERAPKEESFGGILKFKFPEGYLWIDGSNGSNVVSNDSDQQPDCTLSMKLATFEKLKNKKMNGLTAFMFGKVKLKGDEKIALKLMSLI